MPWTTPSYDEIKMDAEIGSYQVEGEEDREPAPAFALVREETQAQGVE